MLTLEECLLGTVKGAHSYHLFPLGEDGSGLDLIFSLLKKSLEEVDHTIGLHFKLISDDFWLIRAASLDVFGIIILTNVKYFMTSNTVQKSFSSFPADLGFVRLTLALTYESYLAHIRLDTWKGDQPVVVTPIFPRQVPRLTCFWKQVGWGPRLYLP